LLQCARDFWFLLVRQEKEKFKFIHISTDEVFGSLGCTGLFSEKSPYSPRSPYSASKASSDHIVSSYFHIYGFPSVITNCSNNYGPFQFPEKLILLVITKCLNQEDIPVYGDGKQIRDWLYVEDHCSALWKVYKNGTTGNSYNIGSHTEKTNLEVVSTVCKILDDMSPSENILF
jgi:dTDP-glucose 4,6-dehydratase